MNRYLVSNAGRNMIKELEGLSLSVYPDADGYSVGYGHFLGKEAPAFKKITSDQAETFFSADILNIETALNRKLTNKKLPQNVIDAAASFAYNLGTGMYLTTLAEYLNKGDLSGGASYMKRIIYSQGKKNEALIKRRAKESALLLQGVTGLAGLLFFLLLVFAIYLTSKNY